MKEELISFKQAVENIKKEMKLNSHQINVQLIDAVVKIKKGLLNHNFKYLCNKTKFKVTCINNHEFETDWNVLQSGHWCIDCRNESFKKSEDEIKQIIKNKKFKLDDGWRYIGCNVKFWITCENNHRFKTDWDCVLEGHGCPVCAKNARKVNEEFIRNFITIKGGMLKDSWRYNGCESKFYIEDCGIGHHKFETTWSLINGGHWCPYCSGNATDEEKIKEIIKSKRGILCKKWEYLGSKVKFFVLCNRGHKFETCSSYIQGGTWCPKCSGTIVYEEEIKEFIKNKGGILDNNWKYVKWNIKFSIKCDRGHIWRASWNSIKSGHWCPYCSGYAITNSDIEKFKESIKNKGGILDDNWRYTGCNVKFWIINCGKGHKFETCWSSLNTNKWCPYCQDFKSENEFRKIIEEYFCKDFPTCRPKWLKSDKGGSLELDGYNEKLKVAFEYQGYQHYKLAHFNNYSQKELENIIKRDNLKEILCREYGILLIAIPHYMPKDNWKKYIEEKYHTFTNTNNMENVCAEKGLLVVL